MHGSSSRGLRRYCRPVIKDIATPPRQDNLPDAPELEPEIDISRNNPNARNALALARGPYSEQQAAPAPISRGALPPMAGGGSSRPPRSINSIGELDVGAPMTVPQASRVERGSIRDDGAFVPEGELGD